MNIYSRSNTPLGRKESTSERKTAENCRRRIFFINNPFEYTTSILGKNKLKRIARKVDVVYGSGKKYGKIREVGSGFVESIVTLHGITTQRHL